MIYTNKQFIFVIKYIMSLAARLYYIKISVSQQDDHLVQIVNPLVQFTIQPSIDSCQGFAIYCHRRNSATIPHRTKLTEAVGLFKQCRVRIQEYFPAETGAARVMQTSQTLQSSLC